MMPEFLALHGLNYTNGIVLRPPDPQVDAVPAIS
jgi:hypothetical protein